MNAKQYNDNLACKIRKMSITQMYNHVMDNRNQYPEYDDLSDNQIIGIISRESIHNRMMIASEQTMSQQVDSFFIRLILSISIIGSILWILLQFA